jgi:uncharacterized membrane protein YeiB
MSTSQPNRITGFDLARALAIFGMMIVNFEVALFDSELNSAAWAEGISSALQGRAAALFVVLAGLGVSLMTRKAREQNDQAGLNLRRRTLLKRSLILFILGVAWMPIWAADILHFYAIYFLVAILLINVSNRQLWLWAAAFLIAFITLFLIVDYDLGWDWDKLNNPLVWTPVGFVRHLFFNGFHPIFPWVSFLIVGMWLGRQNFRDSQKRNRILWVSISIAVGAEALSAYLVQSVSPALLDVTAADLPFLLGSTPYPPLPFYIIAASATATAVIAICVGLTEKYPQSRMLKALIFTGQIALTLYLAHVLVGMGILLAFGLIETQTTQFAIYYAVGFFAISVLFASYWRARFKRGPLEAVMRRLSN